MKKSKLRLVLKIVGALGIAFWLVCCFLGLFYASDGNSLVAFPVTFFIGVLLFLSYFLMMRFQDKDTRQGNAKNAKTQELVFLAVYFVVMVCSAYYVNHIVRVETKLKAEVRDKAIGAIDELTTIFDTDLDHNDNDSYRKYVSKQVDIYKTRLQAENSNVEQSSVVNFRNYMLGLDEYSYAENNYSNLEMEVNKKLDLIDKSVTLWNLFSVLPSLHDLETNKLIWENKVEEYSKAKKNEEYPFVEPFECKSKYYDCTNLTEPLTHATFQFSGTAVLIIVVLQIVILLAYLLFAQWPQKNSRPKLDDGMRTWKKE